MSVYIFRCFLLTVIPKKSQAKFSSCDFTSDSFDRGYPVHFNHSWSYIFSHSVYIGGGVLGGACAVAHVQRCWRVGSLPLLPCGAVP